MELRIDLITIKKASAINLCPTCNAAGKLKFEEKPCNYHAHPSLNYRKIPDGMCALSVEEIEQRKKEYGIDKKGNIVVNKKKRKPF